MRVASLMCALSTVGIAQAFIAPRMILPRGRPLRVEPETKTEPQVDDSVAPSFSEEPPVASPLGDNPSPPSLDVDATPSPPPTPAMPKEALTTGLSDYKNVGQRNKDLGKLELERGGVSAPTGYFDPFGISNGRSAKDVKRWRESEVKHGRLAMLATLGVIVQERFYPFVNPEYTADPGPAAFHWQFLERNNPVVLVSLLALIGVTEALGINRGWDTPEETPTGSLAGIRDNYVTGDLDFDPLGLAPKNNPDKFLEMRTKELNNGRLAMIAWVGMMAQELRTHEKLF